MTGAPAVGDRIPQQFTGIAGKQGRHPRFQSISQTLPIGEKMLQHRLLAAFCARAGIDKIILGKIQLIPDGLAFHGDGKALVPKMAFQHPHIAGFPIEVHNIIIQK